MPQIISVSGYITKVNMRKVTSKGEEKDILDVDFVDSLYRGPDNDLAVWYQASWWEDMARRFQAMMIKGRIIHVSGEVYPQPWRMNDGGIGVTMKFNRIHGFRIYNTLGKSDDETSQPEGPPPIDYDDGDIPF